MIEIITEKVENAIVCNIFGACTSLGECESCKDIVIGIHNWLVATELHYVILDFQDEKDVCSCFLEEILQLRRRMPIPFIFTGMMEKPKQTLIALDYRVEKNIFPIPEDAIELLQVSLGGVDLMKPDINLGEPIALMRSRYGARADVEDDEGLDESAVEAEIDDDDEDIKGSSASH